MQEDLLVEQGIADLLIGFKTYESALDPDRLKFSQKISNLIAETNPRVLSAFWIHFCSRGIGMTEFVEDWILRAGNKCKELGYTTLGVQLCKHAIHEADHHLMMIKDTKNLILEWNKNYSPQFDVEALLSTPTHSTVRHYQLLHEQYIASTEPFCQIAIEYEIENLSATEGAKVLGNSVKILGEGIIDRLSFLTDHIKIDVAHTEYNKKLIVNFINSFPQKLDSLIDAGKKALESYGNFVVACYAEAEGV